MNYEDIKNNMNDFRYYDLIDHPEFCERDIPIALKYCEYSYVFTKQTYGSKKPNII